MVKYGCMWPVLWLAVSVFFWVPVRAEADKPEIQWFFQEFPPIYITDGERKGQGVGDLTLQYFIDRLPAFKHSRVEANYSRAFSAIKGRDGACHSGLFQTPEREEHMVFSDFVQMMVPNRVVLLRETLPRFEHFLNDNGEISLAALVQATDLIAGIVDHRVYSARINEALEQFHAPSRRVRVPYHLSATLLLRKRIDYTFGYLIEAAYLFEKQGAKEDFVTLPIEGEEQVQFARFACSRGPLGHKIISMINKIIASAEGVPEYRRFYTDLLSEDALKAFRASTAAYENK